MIAEADVSGDGRVDYSEFAHLWKTFLLQKHHKPVAGRLQQVSREPVGSSSPPPPPLLPEPTCTRR